MITNGNKKSHSDTVEIDTSNILFIAGGAFVGLENIVKNRIQGTNMGFNADLTSDDAIDNEIVTPDDLVKYGMIPEFVGRFGLVTHVNELTVDQLVKILKEVTATCPKCKMDVAKRLSQITGIVEPVVIDAEQVSGS